jgi:outer membrane lipoprotein carrier protein
MHSRISGGWARHAATTVRMAAACSVLAFAGHAMAGGTDALKNFVAQVHSASGEFTQRQIKAPAPAASGVQAGPQLSGASSGTFSFARPGKFIWAYHKPYEQLLEADGETLYVYDRDLNQVTERKLGNALGASPAAILFGSNDLDAHYSVRDAGVKDGIDWLELTPKDKDTQFQRVGIGFGTGAENGELKAMELHDVFGNVTLLSFSNIQKNPVLPAGTFHFVVPKGADVLKG